ncbi:MAG: 4Fe-4S single cluster domain-containing protein [Campylobacterota bacterium]|nr:4Fe-4S single cluster domain-containing protein [Campylobacterota bacterium]
MKTQTIYIDLIHYPLYVLGPRKRVGVWFEGCSLGCVGCIAQHTWKQSEQNRTTIEEVVKEVSGYETKRVTISGGEPFEQPKALFALLQALRSNGVNDILVYSGYEYGYLQEHFSEILELIDALIDGRFEQSNESQEVYRGSANQKLYILNEDLRPLYEAYQSSTKREVQILDKNEQLYLLGIPKIEDSKEIINGKI